MGISKKFDTIEANNYVGVSTSASALAVNINKSYKLN